MGGVVSGREGVGCFAIILLLLILLQTCSLHERTAKIIRILEQVEQ